MNGQRNDPPALSSALAALAVEVPASPAFDAASDALVRFVDDLARAAGRGASLGGAGQAGGQVGGGRFGLALTNRVLPTADLFAGRQAGAGAAIGPADQAARWLGAVLERLLGVFAGLDPARLGLARSPADHTAERYFAEYAARRGELAECLDELRRSRDDLIRERIALVREQELAHHAAELTSQASKSAARTANLVSSLAASSARSGDHVRASRLREDIVPQLVSAVRELQQQRALLIHHDLSLGAVAAGYSRLAKAAGDADRAAVTALASAVAASGVLSARRLVLDLGAEVIQPSTPGSGASTEVAEPEVVLARLRATHAQALAALRAAREPSPGHTAVDRDLG